MLSHTLSDLASDFNDFSLSIWAFRDDLDCSSSKALRRREILEQEEREREGVCLEAMKRRKRRGSGSCC